MTISVELINRCPQWRWPELIYPAGVRTWMKPGEPCSIGRDTVVRLLVDRDRRTEICTPTIEVIQPEQTHVYTVRDRHHLKLWIDGLPAALLPRAVESDGHSVMRIMIELLKYRNKLPLQAA